MTKQKIVATLCFILSLAISSEMFGQYPPFTKWYQNPLGFKPLNLHTANGIILPAAVATALLLWTEKDKTLDNRMPYYIDIGVSYGYYSSRTTAYQNHIGLLYQARRFMALGVEISTVHVTDDVNHTWGFGLRPFVRFYPLNMDNLKIFFQSGAGLILFGENYQKPFDFLATTERALN